MYKASVENKGDSKYYAITRHSSFVLGTDGEGANPIDALLASLCSCLGHYVRDYLTDHQITHEGFSIEAKAEATEDKARLAVISVGIDLKNTYLVSPHDSELLNFVQNCKVYKILNGNPGVLISLTGIAVPKC